MNLSERIRANSEAPSWVCEAVIKLETERDRLREALKQYADKRNWRRNGSSFWLNIFERDTNGPAIAIIALQEDRDE